MVCILGIRFGCYILFEKNDVSQSDQFNDEEVKCITEFCLIKHNMLGIHQGTMERLLKHDSDLFVCFTGEIPVGMMWGHRGSCYVCGPGIPLVQDSDTVYWFWGLTLPEARGKNVFNRLRIAFFTHYSDTKAFTTLVEPGNKIMRRAMKKMGFVEAKRYYYIKSGSNSLLFEKIYKTNKTNIRIEHGNNDNLLEI